MNSCANVTIKGIDDIATTHPQLIKYFVNEEEAHRFKANSNRKIDLKCPVCDSRKKIQLIQLTKQGFSCPNCSTGVSYPEKFVTEMLKLLGVEFKTQYDEIHKKYRYDFYIPLLNMIIETHGIQHYEGHRHPAWSTHEKEHENDINKWMLAQLKLCEDLKYVVLDCRESKMEWIRNSILNSELNNLFDLSRIDWSYIAKQSEPGLMNQIIKCYKETDLNAVGISKELGLSSNTIRKYLRRATELELIEWEPEKDVSIKTIIMIKNNNVEAVTDNIPLMSELSGYSKGAVAKLSRGKGCSTVASHFTTNRKTKDKIGFYQLNSEDWEKDKHNFTNLNLLLEK